MSYVERFPGKPYGCTCPDWSPFSDKPPPSLADCRALAFPIDPHPVIDPHDWISGVLADVIPRTEGIVSTVPVPPPAEPVTRERLVQAMDRLRRLRSPFSPKGTE